ncbi:MAG: hypothetical protein GWN58_06810, partial [Anaerolineae bacterium]|nr:hypothetical protein [Anaerolineae bacterium]
MNSECRRIYDRMHLYVLMETHPHWCPEAYARVLDRSVKWVRKWQQRFAEDDTGTLAMFRSQSRAPKSRPRETPNEVKRVIADLRDELSQKYHRKAGARLILLELHRQEALQEQDLFLPQSASTINTILKELGYIQKPKPRYRDPVILPEPNEEWEMDFGEIQLDEATSLEFFLVVDRGTSRVIHVEGSLGYTAETALQAVAHLLILNGLPRRLRFDRDPRFVGTKQADYPGF